MNRKVLASVLALFGLSSSGKAADLWSLLGSGDTTLPGGDVVLRPQRRWHHQRQCRTDVRSGEGEGYTSLTVRAFKFTGTLTPSELKLFASNVIRLSVECFNIDAARGPAIQAWMLSNDAREESTFYTAGTRFAEKLFGPLHLELEKRFNGRGHVVAVYLSRAGTPGEAPWIKTCLASG